MYAYSVHTYVHTRDRTIVHSGFGRRNDERCRPRAMGPPRKSGELGGLATHTGPGSCVLARARPSLSAWAAVSHLLLALCAPPLCPAGDVGRRGVARPAAI